MKYVYLFRNMVNDKVYVGQTYNPDRRRSGHLCAARDVTNDYLLPRAMRKYGIDNFKFEVIEECVDDQIDDREKFWIAHYDSTNRDKGYNLYKGGQGHTNETRRKLSEALKDNKHCVGRKLSKKTRQRLSESNKVTKHKRNGEPNLVTEVRTCVCGTQFETTYATNRKYPCAHQFCSPTCANTREPTAETKQKISRSLKFIPDPMLVERIKNGERLTVLVKEFDVSYSTLKKVKRAI